MDTDNSVKILRRFTAKDFTREVAVAVARGFSLGAVFKNDNVYNPQTGKMACAWTAVVYRSHPYFIDLVLASGCSVHINVQSIAWLIPWEEGSGKTKVGCNGGTLHVSESVAEIRRKIEGCL